MSEGKEHLLVFRPLEISGEGQTLILRLIHTLITMCMHALQIHAALLHIQ